MGFSFRKSFKAGPVRINFSKSGIGASIGVKGARIGVNAKGKTYISAGAGGVYCRKTLNGSSGDVSVSSSNGSSSYVSGIGEVSSEILPIEGKIKFSGNGKTIYWRYSTAKRVGFIIEGIILIIVGLFFGIISLGMSVDSGKAAIPLGILAAGLWLGGVGLFILRSKTIIVDNDDIEQNTKD